MPFNLINEAWLPVVPVGGSERRWIRPAEVATAGDVEFAWGRADLNVATYELLIGLLCVAFPPQDDDDWRAKLDTPPSVVDLSRAFAPLVPWFNLDGDGPRFMQDFEGFEGNPGKLESLFLDGPGDNTIEEGRDLFVKYQQLRCLSRPAASIVIYCLQAYTFETAGGNTGRHFSSLRSGGPLVTLVRLRHSDEIWKRLWVNVCRINGSSAPFCDLSDRAAAARMFPWCGPIPISSKERPFEVGPGHAAQSYFGMPRRICLEFGLKNHPCSLTSMLDAVSVTGFRRKPTGIKYGATWRHPLTPYRHTANGISPVRSESRRFGYKEWSGIVYGEQRFDKKGLGRSPATCVTHYRDRSRTSKRAVAITAGGYVVDDATVVDFLEAEFPLILAADQDTQQELESLAHRLVTAADLAANGLRGALRNALGAGSDKTILEGPIETLWADTEQPFRAALGRIAALEHGDVDDLDSALKAECEAWVSMLRMAALAAFDRAVPPEALINKRQSEQKAMIDARKGLVMMLLGYGNGGDALRTALGLAPLQANKKGKRAGKTSGGRKAA